MRAERALRALSMLLLNPALRIAGASFVGTTISDCAGRTGYGAAETGSESLFASAWLSSGGPSTVLSRNIRFLM